jgi:hypothetical protein
MTTFSWLADLAASDPSAPWGAAVLNGVKPMPGSRNVVT